MMMTKAMRRDKNMRMMMITMVWERSQDHQNVSKKWCRSTYSKAMMMMTREWSRAKTMMLITMSMRIRAETMITTRARP